MYLVAAGRQKAALKCARGCIQHRQSTVPSNNFKPKSCSVCFQSRKSSAPHTSSSLDGSNSGAENRVQIDAVDPKTPTTPASAGSTQQGLHGVFSKSLRRHLKIRQAPRPDRLDEAPGSGLANGRPPGRRGSKENRSKTRCQPPRKDTGRHKLVSLSHGGNNPKMLNRIT